MVLENSERSGQRKPTPGVTWGNGFWMGKLILPSGRNGRASFGLAKPLVPTCSAFVSPQASHHSSFPWYRTRPNVVNKQAVFVILLGDHGESCIVDASSSL